MDILSTMIQSTPFPSLANGSSPHLNFDVMIAGVPAEDGGAVYFPSAALGISAKGIQPAS
jgi:hypothetical protein